MDRAKQVFILFVDFVGLLIIVCILLIVLNYFKILPLSENFPKYFGFLPQVQQKTAITTPTPKPINSGPTWDKQAPPELIANYSDYFTRHKTSVSTVDATSQTFLVGGAFTAYNKTNIQIISSEGQVTFQTDGNPVFRKLSPPTTSKSQGGNGADRVTATYNNATDFYNDMPFGSFVQITYQINGDLKIVTFVDYYPDHKY